MTTVKQHIAAARLALRAAEQAAETASAKLTELNEAMNAGAPQWKLHQLNHGVAIAASDAADHAWSAAATARDETRANLSGIAADAAWSAQVAGQHARSAAGLLQWGLDGQGHHAPEMRAELGLA